MQACPNSNCQINAISMNRFYGNYVNKCIHFAGIRVYNVAFVWQTRGQKVYDKLHKICVFFSLHYILYLGEAIWWGCLMNCQRCFLGQMWLVILNNSRALPQICRGAAPICMVVVVVLKVGIGSDPPPSPPRWDKERVKSFSGGAQWATPTPESHHGYVCGGWW